MSHIATPLKWHGGKHYLAKTIVSLMPPHIHYVEPYFGGGQVLFAKPECLIEGHSEVANDVYDDLMNFWGTLKCPRLFGEFCRVVSATPFSRVEFDAAIDKQQYGEELTAAEFFILYRQSRQGLGKDFATLSKNRTRRGMNEQVSSWLSAIEGLPEIHERLQRVVIENREATDIIRSEDSPNTFFYCDPPYLHETRTAKDAYRFEMTPRQHGELLHTLSKVTGKFMLSGYPSELYTSAERKYGWHRRDIAIDNKASGKKTKDVKTECLWANYPLPDVRSM